MPTDHYATLGIARDATQDEIKAAYRRLARRHHPDANDRDPHATERFKEVSHAYEVLKDPEKRRRYDTFGDDRMGDGGFGGMASDFGGLSDLFSSFFGAGTGAPRRSGAARGSDVVSEIELTLEEAARGVRRQISIETMEECEICAGSGAAAGTFPSRCNECGGTGEIRQVRQSFLGSVMTASACPRCGGSGWRIVDACRACGGRGRVRSTQTLELDIPPGVDDGAQLRLSGRGEAGVRGGGKGDLYVGVSVAPHPVFKRSGDDLACEVPVPMTVAALGGTVEVPTLEGDEPVEVTPGTQSGAVVRLKNRGMPRLRGRGRGQLVARLKVQTPTDLSDEESELLERLARLRKEPVGGRGLLGKIREAFH